jgi:uncharacterized protein
MSQENPELARQAYDAWERDGIDGAMPFLDAQIELHNPAEGIGGVFHGHEGMREWIRQVYESFEEVHFVPDRIEELPDGRVLAILHARAKGRGSGVELDVPFAHVIEVRDGKATRLTQYSSVDAALQAVGAERRA